MLLSPNFTLAEMTRTSRPFPNSPSPEEVERLRALCVRVLQPLRDAVGPVIVTSGYRGEEVNRAVGGVPSSQHRRGEAADIRVPGLSTAQVCAKIRELELPFDQLIDEFSSWVHVSHGPRHRRQFLLARTVNGRTVYSNA